MYVKKNATLWRCQSNWKAPSMPWEGATYSFKKGCRATQGPSSEIPVKAHSLGAKRETGTLQFWITEICILCWWIHSIFFWWWKLLQLLNSLIACSGFLDFRKGKKKALLTFIFLLQTLQDMQRFVSKLRHLDIAIKAQIWHLFKKWIVVRKHCAYFW